jgi:predicted lipid-binding transport protein (Tim44 family)
MSSILALVSGLDPPMSTARPRWHIILSLLFCLTVALAPTLAEARAGGGGSFSGGSRGSRSFESNGGSSLNRSMATPASPMAGGAMSQAAGGSFFQRHPFLTGLAGGFLGAALFGGGFFGHAMGGLLTVIVIGLLIFLVIRLFAGAGRGMSTGGGMMAMPRSVGAAAAPQQAYRGRDVNVGDADLSAFQSVHAAVQDAWSHGDLGRLRQLVTPEMLSYFSEELTRNSSRGVQNIVSNVNLVKGDVTEAWEEGDLEYATAAMRWTALDYTIRLGGSPADRNAVVSGNPAVPSEAEEMWTFVRRRGGQWLLSAIQQV